MPEIVTKTRQTGITAITIENFKGISTPVRIALRPITLLFGGNSAGKSTIIHALHYAREFLERNNTNADVPIAGGNAIDLGGFRNMVYRHELSRTIRIGFEITPDDDGLPRLDEITGSQISYDEGYWQTLERNRIFEALFPNLNELTPTPENVPELARRMETLKRNWELVGERRPDISGFIQRAGIEFAVAWDAQRQRPWLNEAIYSLDDRPVFTITQENEGAIPCITRIDFHHPCLEAVFTPVLGDADEENTPNAAAEFEDFFRERQDSQGRVLLKSQSKVIPELTRPLPLDVSFHTDSGDYGYEFFIAAMVNQIILGITALLQDEFAQFRYLGPIRERPERAHRAPSVLAESRWADGSAAWDLLLKHYDPLTQKGDPFVQEVSQWMSEEDRLNLGYSLDVLARRSLPEESMVMANLRLLRDQYDEKDQDFYTKSIWPGIEKAQISPLLELRDLKNDVAVGPADLGTGVIQVTPVIVAALDPSKRVIALEQPELHLHPRVACDLADLFVAQIAKGNSFLIESHSEHLLLRLKRRVREKLLHPDDVSVIFVEGAKTGGRTTIINLGLDSEGEFIREWPGGFFEEGFEEVFAKTR